MARKSIFTAFICALALVASPGAVMAQAWPQKPIRIVVPSPPGDGSDLMARAIGQKLSESLGQQVVVDNKPGAGGRLGTEVAAKAAPDGYTFIMGNAGSHGINSALYKDLPYDIERDFVPITQVMRAPNALVINASLPAGNVRELIALFKADPGKYSYASGGNGSSAHLSAELFKSMAGVDVVHVPYKGATPALTDVIGGQVAFFLGKPAAGDRSREGRVLREAARGDDDAALAARPRHADDERVRIARLRDRRLVRPLRADRHAAGHRQSRRGRDRAHREAAGDARDVPDAGRRAGRQHPRRVRRAGAARHRQVEEGRRGREHQGGLIYDPPEARKRALPPEGGQEAGRASGRPFGRGTARLSVASSCAHKPNSRPRAAVRISRTRRRSGARRRAVPRAPGRSQARVRLWPPSGGGEPSVSAARYGGINPGG